MKIKELKYNNKGLFHYINKFRPFEIEFNPDIMDRIFIARYGNREVSSYVDSVLEGVITEGGMESLGAMLSFEFYDRWHRLYEKIDELVEDNDVDFTITEDVDGLYTRDNKSVSSTDTDNKDSVSGYNSNDFIDSTSSDSRTSSKTDSDGEDTHKRHRIETHKGKTQNNTHKVVNTLTNLSIYDIILLEVSRVVSLLIY